MIACLSLWRASEQHKKVETFGGGSKEDEKMTHPCTLDVKHNYLIALSYLLKNVPKQILLSELPPVSH